MRNGLGWPSLLPPAAERRPRAAGKPMPRALPHTRLMMAWDPLFSIYNTAAARSCCSQISTSQ